MNLRPVTPKSLHPVHTQWLDDFNTRYQTRIEEVKADGYELSLSRDILFIERDRPSYDRQLYVVNLHKPGAGTFMMDAHTGSVEDALTNLMLRYEEMKTVLDRLEPVAFQDIPAHPLNEPSGLRFVFEGSLHEQRDLAHMTIDDRETKLDNGRTYDVVGAVQRIATRQQTQTVDFTMGLTHEINHDLTPEESSRKADDQNLAFGM